MLKELDKIKTDLESSSSEKLRIHLNGIYEYLKEHEGSREVLEKHLQQLAELSCVSNLKFTSYFLEKAAESLTQLD